MFKKGLTLVELIIVAVIVGITAIIIFSSNGFGIFGEKITVTGVIMDVQIISGTYEERESFAVKLKCGNDIITFSAIDRQWATAESGENVTVEITKYGRFHYGKAGTFYNGRLLKTHTSE